MSASREKKQRQGQGGGLTQKQIRERQEQQAHKRTLIIRVTIGAVVTVLVAALLIWNTGFFQRRTVAAAVNGHNYSPTDVAYYYAQQYQYAYMMSNYGMGSFDSSVDPREQYVDETNQTTYYDQFMDEALNELKRVTALLDQAGAENFSDDEAVKEYVDQQWSQIDQNMPANYTRASYLKAVYGRYMTPGCFEDCLKREGLANAYEQFHRDSLSYDEAALNGYYEENKDDLDVYDYSAIFFDGSAPDPTDENGNPVTDENGETVTATDEEKAAAMQSARDAAQTLVDAVQDGGDFDELAAAAHEENEKNTYDGPQTAVLGSSLSSNYKSWLTDAARQPGDVDLVESSSGYYAILFQGRAQDASIHAVDVRHILIQAETTDEDEKDSSGNPIPTQEALDAARARAQELLDQWKAGDKTAESFGALAGENSSDPGSKDNGGLYEAVAQGQFFAAFNDWMFDPARKEGDTELIENPQSGQRGWHVVYFQRKGDQLQWEYTADNALRTEAMNSWIEEIQTDYTAERGDGARYVGK